MDILDLGWDNTMGIYDRDYMQQPSRPRKTGLWIIIGIGIIIVAAFALSQRFRHGSFTQLPGSNIGRRPQFTPPFYRGHVKPEQIASFWSRIKKWHDENTPKDLLRLAAPASQAQLDAFEKSIGAKLPEDVVASYKVCNGTEDTSLVHHGPILSLQEIIKQWRWYQSLSRKPGFVIPDRWNAPVHRGAVKPVWWNEKRIMLTDNSGDHVFLDLDPAAKGTLGQIYDHSHEVGPVDMLAVSFGALLKGIADDLESGKFVYDATEQEIVPKEWMR